MKDEGLDMNAFKAGLVAGLAATATFVTGNIPYQYKRVGTGMASDFRNVGKDMRQALTKGVKQNGRKQRLTQKR